MKKKRSEETACAFLKKITKMNRPKKSLLDKRTELAREFEEFFKAAGIQIYPTMSETEAAFAESIIRSLKKYFTDTWKIMDTSTFTNCLILSQPRSPKNAQ